MRHNPEEAPTRHALLRGVYLKSHPRAKSFNLNGGLENFRLSFRARRRYIMQVAGLVLGVVGALDLALANLKLFPFQLKDRGKGVEPHASKELDRLL